MKSDLPFKGDRAIFECMQICGMCYEMRLILLLWLRTNGESILLCYRCLKELITWRHARGFFAKDMTAFDAVTSELETIYAHMMRLLCL